MIATRTFMTRHIHEITIGSIALSCLVLAGCSSVLNTAGSDDFSCPGMPLGVTCKTPAAVYSSTNGELAVTDFDTPMGSKTLASGGGQNPMSMPEPVAVVQREMGVMASAKKGPRPVREAAKVVRIWIAPWVDKEDNLHLAQTQYTEVTPRTWTVGIDEIKSGSTYVIPHVAFNNIPLSTDAGKLPNDRPAGRSSEEASPSVSVPPTPTVK
jgi:conjugal transfer pilus assembly protein TraV